VFDEADRMLELGYERDVRAIVDAINEQSQLNRQTLLLSATLTKGIEQLSEISMKHPKFVDAAVEGEESETNQVSISKELRRNFQEHFVVSVLEEPNDA
jgi:ATP-dependent RNA helicase DDX31/DBP7